jgi:Sec-independent protein translocase protein TatA
VLKWILIAVLLFLLLGRRRLLGDLLQSVRQLPSKFRAGKDPAAAAKPVNEDAR